MDYLPQAVIIHFHQLTNKHKSVQTGGRSKFKLYSIVFSSIYKELQYIFREGASPPSTSDRKCKNLVTQKRKGHQKKKVRKVFTSYMPPS